MERNIIAVVDDLFFASKIRGTAEELGVTVRFVRNIDAILARHGAVTVPPGWLEDD